MLLIPTVSSMCISKAAATDGGAAQPSSDSAQSQVLKYSTPHRENENYRSPPGSVAVCAIRGSAREDSNPIRHAENQRLGESIRRQTREVTCVAFER